MSTAAEAIEAELAERLVAVELRNRLFEIREMAGIKIRRRQGNGKI